MNHIMTLICKFGQNFRTHRLSSVL